MRPGFLKLAEGYGMNTGRAEGCLNLFADRKNRLLDLIGLSFLHDEATVDYTARFRKRSKAIVDGCGPGFVRDVQQQTHGGLTNHRGTSIG